MWLRGKQHSTLAALTLLGKQASAASFPNIAPGDWVSCGHLHIPNYRAGVQELLEMQMQVTKQCNKKKPIYLMW